MNDFSFTTNEINSVIQDLGLPKNAFGDENSERMKIINCWNSCDIVACPGSGKTTVLLAKLLLLARRMPFNDGRGICCLTHTNVAIDEIKNKLGYKSDILFRHPNFFGTIQQFIDRFLVISYFRQKYNKILYAIDSSVHDNKIHDIFWKKIKSNKDNNGNYKYFVKYDSQKRKYSYNEIGNGIINKFKKNERNNDLLKNYCLCLNVKDINIVSINKRKTLKIDKIGEGYSEKDIIDFLIECNLSIIKDNGIISYDNSYFLANKYLQEYPSLKKIFSKRFKFIFVDEMQDTKQHQLEILQNIFSENEIKQFYGDPDQSIYDGTSDITKVWNPSSLYPLVMKISETKRFGKLIAESTSPFAREIDKIVSNNDSKNIKPYIILFNYPEKVLPKFADIINQFDLEKIKWNKLNSRFNAVGFVGKKDEQSNKIVISSYYQKFKKTIHKKEHFDTLISYFQKQPDDLIKKNGVKIYYSLFKNALIELLYQDGSKEPDKNRNYTETSFFSILKEKNEKCLLDLNIKIAEWIIAIKKETKNSTIIRDEFISFFKINIDNNIIKDFKSKTYDLDFVTKNEIDDSNKISVDDNIDKYNGIEIKVGTVHSVKGETHLATLLLETENYNESEVTYFQEQFCGTKNKVTKNRALSHLKVDYVALTRPEELLCVALQNSKAKCGKCEKQNKPECNWTVVYAD